MSLAFKKKTFIKLLVEGLFWGRRMLVLIIVVRILI